MTRWSLVSVLIALLTLTFVGCMKESHVGAVAAHSSGSNSILVRFAPDGSAFNPLTCDGGIIHYVDGSKTIDNMTQLVVFLHDKKGPNSFLKKTEGVWELVPWKEQRSSQPVTEKPNITTPSDALLVHVNANGRAIQVTDLVGEEPDLPAEFLKGIKNGTVALVSPGSHCCSKDCGGGYWCCRCSNCPWGCSH